MYNQTTVVCIINVGEMFHNIGFCLTNTFSVDTKGSARIVR